MTAIVRRLPVYNTATTPGATELRGEAYPLEIPDGIAIYAAGDPLTPRLPTLGLRALIHNRLRTVIDGDYREVSIVRPWRPWR